MQGAEKRTLWGLIDLKQTNKQKRSHNVQIVALAHLPCTPCMRRDSPLSGAPPQKTMTQTNNGRFVRKRKGQQVSQWYLFICLSLCIMAQTKDFFSRAAFPVNVSYMKPYFWCGCNPQCQILRPCFTVVFTQSDISCIYPRMIVYTP